MKHLFLLLSLFALSFCPLCAHEDTCPVAGWDSRDLVTCYFHNSDLQTQWAWAALSKYKFRGDERVLDFGSGDGKLSSLMAYMVGQGSVTGVDLSPHMTHFASKMFPNPNLSFVTTEDVNFGDFISLEKFDLVTSFCVFHLIPNPSVVLENIRYHMQPNGKLVLAVPSVGKVDFFLVAKQLMAERGWEYPIFWTQTLRMHDPESIRTILESSGFTIDSLEEVDTVTMFGSKREFRNWLEGTLSANWSIPKKDRKEFFREYVKRYLESSPETIDEEGFIHFYCKRVNVVASPK